MIDKEVTGTRVLI